MLQEKFAWATRENVSYDNISRATLHTCYFEHNFGWLSSYSVCVTIFKVKPRTSFTSKISLVSLKRSIEPRTVIALGTVQKSPGGRVGKKVKYAPKLSHTHPLIKQKLISTPPPPHNDDIKTTSTPCCLEKSFLPYLVYLLDFFLRYKYHFKWLLDVCRRVICRVMRITELWACVVFAWIGRFLIFYSIYGTKVPACVGENSIDQLSLAST